MLKIIKKKKNQFDKLYSIIYNRPRGYAFENESADRGWYASHFPNTTLNTIV